MNQELRQVISGVIAGWKQPKSQCVSGLHGSVSESEYQEHSATNGEPAIYVGTYRKYNDGNLFGQWVAPASFDSYDDMMDYLHRLHSDERDPEFMVQDFENFPEAWYSESGISEDFFNRISNFVDQADKDAYEAYLYYFGSGDPDGDNFEDKLVGAYNSEKDFAYELVDEIGWDNIQNKEYYFDYDAFARDLFITDYVYVDGYVFYNY